MKLPRSAGGRCFALLAAVAWLAAAAQAQDPENCLSCHRFRGLSRLDPQTNELRLFFCSAEYFVHRQGAHARLRCTACHVREEVQVIPHQVKTPVDCTQTCHITPAAEGLALTFSHQGVADSLVRSAHAPENLADLPFDPPALRPGQSTCLYCHDQPTFGIAHGIPEGFRDHSGGTRCDTCHKEALPLEINYFANHVASRMKPARPVRQLAQVCAVCHSDKRVLARLESHDVVASYLHSFHGKASLLGSHETATCVDCHSSHEGDQHLMLAADQPDSSINPVQLPDTCRTPACHSGFPPEMSSAAVHLELDPTERPPEFFVAAFFILLTAIVMALFFALVVLEFLNVMLRRTTPEHHRLNRLARTLQAHPEARRSLHRMTLQERFQHWWLAISFILLVLTGMPIKFADAAWAEQAVRVFGGLSMARLIHRISGVVLLAVFIYHFGYLAVRWWQTVRRARREGRDESAWRALLRFPMLVWPRDVLEFAQLFLHLLGLRKTRPHFGRYNVLEKFEYWAVFWGIPIMGLSGLALWSMPWISAQLSGRAINFAYIIHSDEAYLAFIYIATIHLFTVIFAPTVFPLSLGTLTGQAPVQELVEGHRGHLEELAHQYGITLPEEPHAPLPMSAALRSLARSVVRRVYAALGVVVYVGLTYVSLSFLLAMLFTEQSAPAEIVDIPRRLDADLFLRSAAAPVEYRAELGEQVRGPLAHFHLIPQWFQPDPGNTCTTAGCHNPLPHGNRVEVRAFLNMHATFVDCMVCHDAREGPPDRAAWFDLPERRRAAPPAILRLASRLESLPPLESADVFAVNRELEDLLADALPASGHNAQLENWLVRLRTTHPRSAVWRRLVNEMRREIALHVRGEYDAKIGLFDGNTLLGSPNADQRAATEQYLRQRGSLSEQAAKPLLDRVHAGVLPVGAMCTPCHSDQPTLVDLGTLGYPAERVTGLRESQIIRSVLSIESGRPFHLPLGEDQETE